GFMSVVSGVMWRYHLPTPSKKKMPMITRTRVQVLLLAVFTSVAGLMATRQLVAAAAQATAAAQPMPVDPAIATAKLANGLRYYVRANAKPDKRAELRLVVRA